MYRIRKRLSCCCHTQKTASCKTKWLPLHQTYWSGGFVLCYVVKMVTYSINPKTKDLVHIFVINEIKWINTKTVKQILHKYYVMRGVCSKLNKKTVSEHLWFNKRDPKFLKQNYNFGLIIDFFQMSWKLKNPFNISLLLI